MGKLDVEGLYPYPTITFLLAEKWAHNWKGVYVGNYNWHFTV